MQSSRLPLDILPLIGYNKHMKLLTNDIKRSLPALYSTESTEAENKTILAKFFNPIGAGTWYVVEGDEQEDGDWVFFGLVDLQEKE